MFAAFTPVAWPAGSPGFIADPSGRICIVSLVNAHDRPFRLQLKVGQEQFASCASTTYGPYFGRGWDIAVWPPIYGDLSYCQPESFELDETAEREAGLPPLPFKYDKTLLSGVDDGKDRD